jgi:hypothetical protein
MYNWTTFLSSSTQEEETACLFKASVPTGTTVWLVSQCSTIFMLCRCSWAGRGHARQRRATWCACVTCNDSAWPRDQSSSATRSCTATPACARDASNTSVRVSDRLKVRWSECVQYCHKGPIHPKGPHTP